MELGYTWNGDTHGEGTLTDIWSGDTHGKGDTYAVGGHTWSGVTWGGDTRRGGSGYSYKGRT